MFVQQSQKDTVREKNNDWLLEFHWVRVKCQRLWFWCKLEVKPKCLLGFTEIFALCCPREKRWWERQTECVTMTQVDRQRQRLSVGKIRFHCHICNQMNCFELFHYANTQLWLLSWWYQFVWRLSHCSNAQLPCLEINTSCSSRPQKKKVITGNWW